MPHAYWTIALNLGCAWAAGSLIGLERSHNGRAAGFRTQALVALAAAAVMSIAYAPQLLSHRMMSGLTWLEPTRLAQGCMTGVGFLGAGVIFKEGVSVQGLTTAACTWATSAIGLLFGLGLYWPGVLMTTAVLITLTVFRWLEDVVPERTYALAVFRFDAGAAPAEPALREFLGKQDVVMVDISYGLIQGGDLFEYKANLVTRHRHGLTALAAKLRDMPGLTEFQVSRISK